MEKKLGERLTNKVQHEGEEGAWRKGLENLTKSEVVSGHREGKSREESKGSCSSQKPTDQPREMKVTPYAVRCKFEKNSLIKKVGPQKRAVKKLRERG